MRWHKFISVISHPIVMPTVGVLLYFILIQPNLYKQQQYAILSIVFVATYIIPFLLLFFLKGIGYIKSYKVQTIEERKIPLFFMIFLFFILGRFFLSNSITREISNLFYGTAVALILVYFIFFLKIKTSLHLLSMGSAVGFFLTLQHNYGISILPLIALFILLSGILASARLYLKVHTTKEVYLGFFIGLISQFVTYSITYN